MIKEGLGDLDPGVRDVCVVGSGPVGLALATRLARQGASVLVLESGKAKPSAQIQSLAEADLDPQVHDAMAIVTARQLGGASNLWGGRSLPLDPIDFEPREWIDARWPIDYADMAAYLPDAVAATTSGAPVFEDPPNADFDQSGPEFRADVLERWVNTQRAQIVHAAVIRSSTKLEVRTGVTVTGLSFAENGALAALTVKASNGSDERAIAAREVVLAAGGLETTRILLAAQRKAPDRFGGIGGPLGRYYQGHLVGEIAELSFARPELAAAFDFRVDAHGSYVRRRIVAAAETQRAHRLLNCAFWPVVPKIGHADHGSAILSMVWLAMKAGPLARLIVAEKIRQMNFTAQDSPVRAHLANIARGAPAAALFGAQFLARRFDRRTRLPGIFLRNPRGRYGLSYHSEQHPSALSRVTLSDRTDRLGMPRLAIDLRFTDADADATLRQHELLEGWLMSAGLGKLRYHLPVQERAASILEQARHGTHQIGIARMATSRTSGVADADCTTFDCPNLHLATTALLPTSGQANPTLTSVALALRLADKLARRMAQPPAAVSAGARRLA